MTTRQHVSRIGTPAAKRRDIPARAPENRGVEWPTRAYVGVLLEAVESFRRRIPKGDL
jgi:hypothetical protein